VKRLWFPVWSLLVISLSAGAQQPPAPIVVTTTGEAQMRPDRAVVRFVLFAEGETVGQARHAVKQLEANALNSLAKVGVPDQQVTLERFEIIPLQPSLPTDSSIALKPLGYRVAQEYHLVLPVDREKLDRIVQVVDLLMEVGARPGGILTEWMRYDARPRSQFVNFIVSNPQALTEQAVQDAVKRATQMAEQMASQMGRSAVRLIHISVNMAPIEPPRQPHEIPRELSRLNAWEPVRVQVQVTATFGI
jgi:uncharacterized protein YggE